jgi:ABC-type phosphate transport system substrate-binding protein
MRSVHRRLLTTLAAFFLATAGAAAAETAAPFVVIVNAANPLSSASRAEVASLFMKRKGQWPDGQKCRPVDLAEGSRVRDAFSQQVLGRRTPEIDAYWQSMIFSGRDIPPPKKATEDAVVDFVARTPGGIGYVSPGARLTAGVKILPLNER